MAMFLVVLRCNVRLTYTFNNLFSSDIHFLICTCKYKHMCSGFTCCSAAVLLVAVLRFYLLQRCGFTCCRAAVLLVAVLLFYLLQGCGFTCCSAAVLLVAVLRFYLLQGCGFTCCSAAPNIKVNVTSTFVYHK